MIKKGTYRITNLATGETFVTVAETVVEALEIASEEIHFTRHAMDVVKISGLFETLQDVSGSLVLNDMTPVL